MAITPSGDEPRELSIYLTDNDEIQQLNKQYRSKDQITDVLSFPQEEPLLGDIVVSLPQVSDQAEENGNSFEYELIMILIHGLLHLLGYDHEDDESAAKEMFEIQDRFMEEIAGDLS